MAEDDMRTFLRELLLRHERVTQAMIDQLEANTRAVEQHRREFVEESRAHREALFKVLDRLGPGGAGPAPA